MIASSEEEALEGSKRLHSTAKAMHPRSFSNQYGPVHLAPERPAREELPTQMRAREVQTESLTCLHVPSTEDVAPLATGMCTKRRGGRACGKAVAAAIIIRDTMRYT